MMAFSVQGMYDWAVQECQRSDVAYSQTYRNQQTVNGITYYDCSSFTFFACWLGGGLDVGALGYSTDLNAYHNGTANAWTVTWMIRSLQNVSGFEFLDPKTVSWQAGDILAKTRTHTEICYLPPRQTMGAHSTAGGVSINQYQTSIDYYDVLIRYTGSPGPVPPGPTLPMPIWLIKRAIELNRGGIPI